MGCRQVPNPDLSAKRSAAQSARKTKSGGTAGGRPYGPVRRNLSVRITVEADEALRAVALKTGKSLGDIVSGQIEKLRGKRAVI